MAEKSGVGLRISAGAVPLLPGTRDYAEAGYIAGGLGRNRTYFEGNVGGIRFAPEVDAISQTILFDPQTSGGLLFAVDPDQATAFETAFVDAGVPLWRIGEVVAGAGIDVVP